MRVLLCFQRTRKVRFKWNMYNFKFNYLSRGQLVSLNLDKILPLLKILPCYEVFFGNLIFAIIARMLCGNHLKCFSLAVPLPEMLRETTHCLTFQIFVQATLFTLDHVTRYWGLGTRQGPVLLLDVVISSREVHARKGKTTRERWCTNSLFMHSCWKCWNTVWIKQMSMVSRVMYQCLFVD